MVDFVTFSDAFYGPYAGGADVGEGRANADLFFNVLINGSDTETNGVAFVGGRDSLTIDLIEPQVPLPTFASAINSADEAERVFGTYRPETDDYDISKDYWVLNPFNSAIDWDNIWLYFEEVDAPQTQTGATGGVAYSTAASFNTWIPQGATGGVAASTFSFAETGTQNATPAYWFFRIRAHALEKATTPTGSPAVEGATDLGVVEVRITNSLL